MIKNRGKAAILYAVLSIMLLQLSGCASINDIIGNQIKAKSGVCDDEAYVEYKEYEDAGILGTDGYLLEEENENNNYGIHVTFAKNNNLNITYFEDSTMQMIIEGNDCRLTPGGYVYASVSVADDVFSSMYGFREFRIYEYDDAGKRKLSSKLTMEKATDSYVLHIPDDFEGKDITIEPIGEYSQRVVKLYDYYMDDDDVKHELSGEWTVNDKVFNGDSVEINPITSYIISYEYDSDEYFYISSTPECFYTSIVDGIVIFKQREAEDETSDYSVELHKYITERLVSDMERHVKVNGGDEQTIGVNEELLLSHLMYGDRITIETDREWNGLDENRDLLLSTSEIRYAGTYKYKYTFIVPEKGGEFQFDPSEYKYANGEIRFKCFGKEAITTQWLKKGSKIYYEQKTADKGYWLAGKAEDHFVVVGDADETKKALQAIHFTPKVDVTVRLPQPEAGGTIYYYLDGKRVYGNSCSTYSGADITMSIEQWEGWIVNEKCIGTIAYKVGESKHQTVTANGVDINRVFTEDDDHKPELTLRLEKSVGETMGFTLTASGYQMDLEKYAGGWKFTDIFDKNAKTYDIISNDQILVSGQKIGTDKPIQMSMFNRAIQSGKAVRLVIVYTNDKKEKTTETRYVVDLSKVIDPIYIYSPGTHKYSTVWYKTVDITIGFVDVCRFEAPPAFDNTRITVTNLNTNRVLKTGDYLEASDKVSLEIRPLSGYYITGDHVNNDVYSETMKYSEYEKNIADKRLKHLPAKYYEIKLDKSDSYAKYTYKLDGKEVEGTIWAKAGQKLELIYEITDKSYKLKEAEGGFLFIGGSYTKAVKSMSISASNDGKTVTRGDFGIMVEKGGN